MCGGGKSSARGLVRCDNGGGFVGAGLIIGIAGLCEGSAHSCETRLATAPSENGVTTRLRSAPVGCVVCTERERYVKAYHGSRDGHWQRLPVLSWGLAPVTRAGLDPS